MPDFGDPPINMRNGIPCCHERHPLLLECFITSLRYIKKMGVASDSIYKLLMAHTMSFPQSDSNIAHKTSDLWYPLGTGNGILSTRKDIHCC